MRNPIRVVAALAAPLPILAFAAVPAFAGSSPTHAALRGQTVAAVGHAARTGAVASDKQMSVTVSLAPRDQTALQAFIKSTGERTSANYHHYLTPAQFASRFGPSSDQINTVTSYLKSAGLSVGNVDGGHLTVTAHGTAAQLEKAFGTHLSTYYDSSAKRSFFANDTAPSLPADVASSIVAVTGLDNYAVMHNDARVAPHKVSARGPVGGMSPTQIRGAYNLTSTVSGGDNGSGVTVALAEFDGFSQTNITKYDSQYGISTSNPTKVAVDGGSGSLGEGQVEVELDIEVVQAIAPGAKIDVYEAPNTDQGEIDLYSSIVNSGNAVMSTSWGIDEPDEPSANRTADNNEFSEAAAQGQSLYAASGDDGSDDAGNGGTSVDFPASDPYVTGSGGTTLRLSGTTWSSETAWSGSGGGKSADFATPSFQTSVNTTGKREVPDVAADANPSTGWSIYSAGAWQEVGGTSAAAPNWAAFTAIYDQAAASAGVSGMGYANQTIYSLAQGSDYSSAFHDVKTGSNGAFSAKTGYDPVTGWGSYNGANFIADSIG